MHQLYPRLTIRTLTLLACIGTPVACQTTVEKLIDSEVVAAVPASNPTTTSAAVELTVSIINPATPAEMSHDDLWQPMQAGFNLATITQPQRSQLDCKPTLATNTILIP